MTQWDENMLIISTHNIDATLMQSRLTKIWVGTEREQTGKLSKKVMKGLDEPFCDRWKVYTSDKGSEKMRKDIFVS